MLELKDVHLSYGAIQAVRGASLEVREGEIVTLIGPNGAGKTTIMRAISGLLKPKQGHILYLRQDLMNQATHAIVASGLAHVPEGRLIFGNLSVYENLLLGAYTRTDKNFKAEMDFIFNLFPRLSERIKQNAGTLSGGEQQMLAIGRALMGRPKLLLLDEPSLGIAPLLAQQIFKALKQINEQGMTLFIVEQNANLALKTAHRAYVMESGEIKMHGAASDMLKDPKILKAYLGGD